MTQPRAPFRFGAIRHASCTVLSIVALICVGVYGSPVVAASAPSAYTNAADNLAFGLDRIRWGMSSAEVQLAYPRLHVAYISDHTGEPSGPAMLTVYGYPYGVCFFDLSFVFFHDRLASVQANSTIDGDPVRLEACRMEVREDFASRYGKSGDLYPHWQGPVTNVAYDIPQLIVGPTLPPGPRPPRPLHIVFSDEQDISGAVAEQHAHDNECLSITAEVIGGTPSDGSYAPSIVPPLRNLGCDYYPPVSWRLFEQGKVIVEARILADGSVAEAKIAVPHKSPRLNETALDIVRRRLLINPAFKDGKPVEATRQIAVTFKLTRFFRGVQ